MQSGEPDVMLKTILVATDFSVAARRAVMRAALLAKQGDSSLHVLHVLPERSLLDRLLHRSDIDRSAVTAGAERALQAELQAINSHPGVQATAVLREGTAQKTITEVADEIGATLVVIGAHGESQISQGLRSLGGTALKCFARASRPMLLVRRHVDGSYYKILAAVDDTGEAIQVLSAASGLSGSRSLCQALHVFDPPFAARLRTHNIKEATIGAYAEREHERAEHALQRRLDLLECARRISPIVVRGNAAETILKEVRERQPDLLVMGKRQRLPDAGPHGDHYFGSVSLHVAFEATTDVLIIP
jgi:nucleotide-binding universal stress UspA family protein